MKKSTIYLIFLTLFASCKDFVTIDPPKTSPVPEAVFNDPETANSSLLTIFAGMSDDIATSSYWLPLLTGVSSDELVNNNGSISDFYQNFIDPKTSSRNTQFWNGAYNYIFAANTVYEGCERSSTLPARLKQQLMAEALFVRAYWHFYLVNLYGNIPLALTTDYKINLAAKRQDNTAVYEQITKDLLYAQTNLNESYVGPDGLTITDDRVRPNKDVATALLARVYLYTKNYSAAETAAGSLIDKSTIYKLEPLGNVFLKESKEAIWQIMPRNNNSYNTQEGNMFIPTNTPAIEEKATMSSPLLSAFDDDDLRKSAWVGMFEDNTTVPSTIYYYPNKYKVQIGDSFTEYSVIFRLGEMFLIKAEAEAEQNKMDAAINDTDYIRLRAGKPSLQTTNSNISKTQLLKEILKERQVELFAEQGHRWLDLKRTSNVDAVMSTVTPLKGGSPWNSTKQLWPLPYNEILNGPNLIQNPGYN